MPPRKSDDSGFIYDAVTTFEAGVNAGVDAVLLPKNQCAMSTNVSYRGGFIGPRPPFRKIDFNFGGDVVLESNIETQGFQGACFYKSDFGTQHLFAQIGGRLFLFTPDADFLSFTPLDVSIPGDLNPTSALQAWMFQAERWVIITDGESLPIFFDGVVSRRSFGPSVLLATVVAPGFTAPAKGASVQVNVAAIYSGPFNVPVLVIDSGSGHSGTYTILPAAPGPALPNARLKTIYVPGGPFNILVVPSPNTPVAIGAQVLTIPSRIGIAYSTAPPSQGAVQQVGLTNPPNNQTMSFFSGALTPAGIPLATWTADNKLFTANFVDDRFVAANPFLYEAFGEAPVPFVSHTQNDFLITYSNPTANTLVGTVVTGFTTANRLSTIDVVLDVPYTGPDDTPVWIDNMLFLISKIPAPAPTTTVTLVNQNDTAGFVYPAGTTTIESIAELPAGRMGDYGLGRIWLSLVDGRQFMAGDIVGGSSGSPVYKFRDAILKSTENSFLAGGGNFSVPGSVGDITAMRFTATLDVSLGQGPLQVFTRRSVFSCMAPVDRTVWQAVTNPILTQSLIGSGAQSQNATTNSNNDTLFRSIDGIRSLILARREFDVWGNVPQSREVENILRLDNNTLLQFGSAVDFDNRRLVTCIPTSGPRGTFHQGLIALNYDELSNLRGKAPSIYDGFWTGLNVLQVITGVFAGVERCYAFCSNATTLKIELYELLPSAGNRFDNTSLPITLSFETPIFFKTKNPDDLRYMRLENGEIAVSDMVGVVTFQVWYRSDENQCWEPWRKWTVCAANNGPDGIPQFRPRMGFGTPTQVCDNVTNRPTKEGYYFQLRVQISGSCKVKRIKLAASMQPEPEFAPPMCGAICQD